MTIEETLQKIAADGWLANVGCVMDRNGYVASLMSNSCDFQIHSYADNPTMALEAALFRLEAFAHKDLTAGEPASPRWEI